jgi:hypothetical protein
MAPYSAKRIAAPTTTTVRPPAAEAKSAFQTLKGLKDRTYRTWKSLHRLHAIDATLSAPTSDKVFKQSIRQFGDLRRKTTWENAWCALYAQSLVETAGDNVRLIQRTFTTSAQSEGWAHLLPQVLDNFLEDEDGKKRLRDGLERIRITHHGFPQELAPFAQVLSTRAAFQKEPLMTFAPAA